MSVLHSIPELVSSARAQRASDIHIVCGIPIRIRVDGRLHAFDNNVMTDNDCEYYCRQMSKNYDAISEIGEQDLALTMPDGSRCRVAIYRQQGHVSAAIRLLNDHIPSFNELGLPAQVHQFTEFKQGIILVTGETGSGKSTTLACLLDKINHTQTKHIITLEDPIEYVYKPDLCIINQREIGQDTVSFQNGLTSLLRADPDVILVGEMRNLATIEAALMAAETGHLVFATLHTNSAADTIDRIVEVFPHEEQEQIRIQLSMSLQAVLCQQLLPHQSGRGRVLASEVMIVTPAIRNLIREGKSYQIPNIITTTASEGNHLMDTSLVQLHRQHKISTDVMFRASHDREYIQRAMLF